MFNLLLDIFIYNYTPFKSIFFLLNIHNKDIISNLMITLFIDIFITRTYIINTIIFIIIYYINKKYINITNIFNYYLVNILIILIYYLLLNNITLLGLINVLLINSTYILISYKIYY